MPYDPAHLIDREAATWSNGWPNTHDRQRAILQPQTARRSGPSPRQCRVGATVWVWLMGARSVDR
jgi:hypothetical protein